MKWPFSELGEFVFTPSGIAQFLLILLLAVLFSVIVRRVLSQYLLRRIGLGTGQRESVAAISSYAIGTFLCVVLLQATGINIDSLAVVAGSLGIGIGFGLQEVTKNFISGLTLLLEQKIKVGDFIEIDELLGHITEISLRSTVIRTVADRHIVLPNSDLVSKRVINWTYSNTKGWVSIPVSVSHESDPLLVIEVLMDSAYLEEAVSTERVPEVYFTNIGESSLDFKLWAWTDEIDQKFKIESSLNFIIRQNLKQHGIWLASPRMNVWHRNPNVVVQTEPQEYAQYAAALQRPQDGNLDAFSKPVAVRDLIKQIPFFAQCSDLELRKLVEIGRRIRLEPLEVLYEEGDPGDAFYIILSGEVSYTLDETTTTIMKAGQFVGEFSLMLKVPRTVTTIATVQTTLFMLKPQGFQKLLRDQPHLYDLIVEEMGRHQAELSQQGRQLRALGLINQDEYSLNPVAWIRKRLETLLLGS